MDKKQKRFGDRYDGRRIRSLSPMCYVSPFIMRTRTDAMVFFENRIDFGRLDRYIRETRVRNNMPGFGFMHVFIAAYVRMLSQRPGMNRFISGQRIFKRDDITMSMMVKKGSELNSQETGIKVVFEPSDTIWDVYNKMNEAIAGAREEGDTTALDALARALIWMPAIIFRLFVNTIEILDYFGIMPRFIYKASPFHAGFFISNLASLDIPPVYHHIYNFGNVPVFLVFGKRYRENFINLKGESESRKYIDYKAVIDERITDGAYMASALKVLEKFIKHPERLEVPPDKIEEDID
ncbi:MAG: hypothetical protein VB120_07655 [Lachnospiraceae bacterium]|nr:hypothetical protein [Lachnospiraceae bacterium]